MIKQKHITVHNFGPLKDVDVNIKSVNIFIGEQSIGKSTIAKLINIFTDVTLQIKLILGGKGAWIKIIKDFNLSFCLNKESYSIKYNENYQNFEINFNIKNGDVCYKLLKNKKEIALRKDCINTILSRRATLSGEVSDQLLAAIYDKDDINTKDLDLFIDSLYIPTERIMFSVIENIQPALMMSNAIIPNFLLRFMLELNKARTYKPEWDIDILKILFRNDGHRDIIYLTDSNKEFPLDNASSGIQTLLPLYLTFNYTLEVEGYSTFVVEEPECNLFPDKQVELLNYLIYYISKEEKNLIITTHSPYILSAMNNILFAGYISKKMGNEGSKKLISEFKNIPLIDPNDCSVYSLGEKISHGKFCNSIIDKDSNMIDFNALDGISIEMGEQFEKLEDTYIDLVYEKNDRL